MSEGHVVDPTLSDTDWLALVLCGLHELNEGDRRLFKKAMIEQAESYQALSDSDPVARYAPVLDSLARLLIYQPRKQIVSVTLLPPAPVLGSSKPAKFLLAQTGGAPSDVRDQLIRIIGHIRRARLLYVESQGADARTKRSPLTLPSLFPKREELNPLEAELYDTELALIWYCWRKIERRLQKDNRDLTFRDLAKDVAGAPAGQRADLDDRERFALEQLQSQGEAQRETLTDLVMTVEKMERILVNKPGPPYKSKTSEQDRAMLEALRTCITYIHHVLSQDQSDHLLSLCDKYVEARRLRQAHISRKPTKSWAVTRWLTKVVSVRHDFAKILSFVRSRTMSSLLEQGPEFFSVPGPRESRIFEISDTDVQSALQQASWKDIQANDPEQFVQKLRKRLTSFQSKDDFNKHRENMIVHCECALLAHLHDESKIRPTIPYVGVSKPSCQLCHLYFKCYSAVTGTVVHTRGTHGQLGTWQTPSLLPSDVDEDRLIRNMLREKLQEKLVAEVARSRSNQRLSTSQSTVASEGDEVVNQPVEAGYSYRNAMASFDSLPLGTPKPRRTAESG